MNRGRLGLFLTTVLSVWSVMHVYVFWRLGSVPWVAAHCSRSAVVLGGLAVWASYPLARILEARGLQVVAAPLQLIGANWIGVLFLLLSALLVTDVVTLGGWLLPEVVPTVRGWAALGAVALSVTAMVQGLRAPVVRDYDVELAGLPEQRDGLVLVTISDLHLGALTGRGWLERVVQRVNDMHADLVVLVGDILEGNGDRARNEIVPTLARLRAPLGVWGVTGNHEFYSGLEPAVALMASAGCRVLRDRWVEVTPGLVLAGVDDLTGRGQFGTKDEPLQKALANRPAGAAILLSHTPCQAETAAAAGSSLMLCGHTHNGQIWPFNYLVRLRYPLLGGRYEVGGMTVIVCRGTGTWGPRMRLWRPGEMLRINLKSGRQATNARRLPPNDGLPGDVQRGAIGRSPGNKSEIGQTG